jgi:nucleotide-binding universal stress UspA family protein
MYRKILVPLDGSPLAEGALPPALSLAERSGGELHLATVVPSLRPLAFSTDEGGARLEDAKAEAAARLESVRARIERNGTTVPLRTHVFVGTPVRVLHDWILENGVDQVVMTRRGRGSGQRLRLGSVADGLVRRVPSPVLLWRTEEEPVDLGDRPVLRTVLVPLDGSEVAGAMVPWAHALARLFDASLVLLSVVVPGSATGKAEAAASAKPEASAEPEPCARRMEEYLEGVARELRRSGVPIRTEVLPATQAAGGIRDFRKRIGADLVALSTRGRGGAARLVLGSVADEIIRSGEGHVLVHLDAEDA